ncbi:MAG: hypothetical protein ABJN35_07230 [Erythrobacter sp.]
MLIAIPAFASAQNNPHNVAREDSAFVDQAPIAPDTQATEAQSQQPQSQPAQPAPRADASSKVYFPEAITPQSVAAARARNAQQEQLTPSLGSRRVAQVPSSGSSTQPVPQLSTGQSTSALNQLSAAERQVLLDAVEGTDICERSSDIPALKELCEGRIETRSSEFAQNAAQGSAEDSLLGGGLDSARIATLEAAISRLAQNAGDSGDFSTQVIASVALGNTTLTDAQATSAENDPTSELSTETQAVVQAIVQQLGGN